MQDLLQQEQEEFEKEFCPYPGASEYLDAPVKDVTAWLRSHDERILQRVIQTLHVGSEKEAEFAAIRMSEPDIFMEGFRYARNNLQKHKSDLLSSLGEPRDDYKGIDGYR